VGPARRVHAPRRGRRAGRAARAARGDRARDRRGRLLAIIPDVYGPDDEPTLNIFYLAHVVAGTAAPASDVSEIGWFGAAALPQPAEIAFACVADALERWRTDM